VKQEGCGRCTTVKIHFHQDTNKECTKVNAGSRDLGTSSEIPPVRPEEVERVGPKKTASHLLLATVQPGVAHWLLPHYTPSNGQLDGFDIHGSIFAAASSHDVANN
jgi:hypothetical protein